MILFIDNYDSFVHNLERYVKLLGYDTEVHRNDKISLADISRMQPSHIILSPGPCSPNEAGICLQLINHFAAQIPMLGVCLGHQAIGQVFGANIATSATPMHGQSSLIHHDTSPLFINLPNPLQVGRYHSLSIHHKNFPNCLEINAQTQQGEIMAIRHKQFPTYGVQFHPESILTQHGETLLQNFISQTSLDL